MNIQLQRLMVRLTANRKQFGILCAGVTLSLLLWGRLIVIANIPRTAIAEPGSVASPGLDMSAADPKGGSSKSGADNRARSTIRITRADGPKHDPFVIDERFFPRLTKDGDLAEGSGKSQVRSAEDPELIEARLQAQLQSLVDREFVLDAVMTSASLAVINGRTYRQGDELTTTGKEPVRFRLTGMEHRSVTLEYEGRRFELKMGSAGG